MSDGFILLLLTAITPQSLTKKQKKMLNIVVFSVVQSNCIRATNKCATNILAQHYDNYCSDKGTFWQSRHHYANAYNAFLHPIRGKIRHVLEIGIGEDTAPSIATWLDYFNVAHIYAIDIKTRKEFEYKKLNGEFGKLLHHQSQFGCVYNDNMWLNKRAHLFLDTNASNVDEMERINLPNEFDLIIDDGSHVYRDQVNTLKYLFSRLRSGGFYIIEDLLVGSLPWKRTNNLDIPTNNTNCGGECYYPQRLDEHPFLFDRYNLLKRKNMDPQIEDIFRNNDWFWAVTGVHKGGGVDASLIIRKSGVLFVDEYEYCFLKYSLFTLPLLFLSVCIFYNLWFQYSNRFRYHLVTE